MNIKFNQGKGEALRSAPKQLQDDLSVGSRAPLQFQEGLRLLWHPLELAQAAIYFPRVKMVWTLSLTGGREKPLAACQSNSKMILVLPPIGSSLSF